MLTRRVLVGACAVVSVALGAALNAQRQSGSALDVRSRESCARAQVTLTLSGPQADELSNPRTRHRLSHDGDVRSRVGLADVQECQATLPRCDAANSSAIGHNRWRSASGARQDRTLDLSNRVRVGKGVALAAASTGQPLQPFDGRTGTFEVAAPTRKFPISAPGTGCSTPESTIAVCRQRRIFSEARQRFTRTLLAYADFDGTVARKTQVPLHAFTPHVKDWQTGDPTWKGGKGKGLIGAVNYLASKGVNSISFLPYNAGGDGDNVWPFVSRDDKFHYDVSKLDQWQIVFDHAQQKGMYLHFKLQENEIDDNVRGNPSEPARGGRGPVETGPVTEALDGGDLGQERRLYIRELVARFGYELALNWNIGEENTQSSEQQLAMALNLRDVDPYGGHHIVVHTFPNRQEDVYPSLLGSRSPFTGASLQMSWNTVHEER